MYLTHTSTHFFLFLDVFGMKVQGREGDPPKVLKKSPTILTRSSSAMYYQVY